MISKEQLQELIKQGVTIYRLNHLANKIETVLLDKKDYISIGFLNEDVYVRGNPELRFYDAWYKLEDLFETEEDAKWELEMTATRTEILSLPNYKVAKTYIDTDKFILEDNSKFKFLLLSNPDNIIIVDKQQGNQIFNKPLTKDNYIEACKLCLKLFKGGK